MYKFTVFKKVKDKSKESLRNGTKGELITIDNFFDLKNYVFESGFSHSVFKDNYRNKKNFLRCDFVAIDIDEKLGHKEVIEDLINLKLKFILGFTTNHNKEKNGLKCERFRFLVPLSEAMMSDAKHRAVLGELFKVFPEADRIDDPSRLWVPFNKDYELITSEEISLKGNENE